MGTKRTLSGLQECETVRMTERPRTSAPALDEPNRAIIDALREDGRMPYAAIGKRAGLSEAAVRGRVQRLIESGMIQVVAVTDPTALGMPRQAMVGVKVAGSVDAVCDALGELPEVRSLVVAAGSYDLLVEIACEDDRHVRELVSERFRAVPGVLTTETFLYLERRRANGVDVMLPDIEA